MSIRTPKPLSYEITNTDKVFCVLQDTIATNNAWNTPITVMQSLKDRIDDLKNRYEELQDNDVAQKVSWWINPLNRDLKAILKKEFNVTHSSNGFIKMFEILAMVYPYPDRIVHDGKVRVFGNAELPGAMLLAVNHFYAQRNIKMDFVFSSLVDPEDPNKLGDQYGLVQEYPSNFIPLLTSSGSEETHTGNVADPSEVEYIKKMVDETGGKVDFYFADGGINVSHDYNNQDRENAHVNLGQIICGLLTLKKGGLFITKQYNFTGSWVWTLDLLVASLFSRSSIVKPASSRHSNSECYLVGIDYVGMYPELENYLLGFLRRCHKDGNYVRNILPPNKLTPPIAIQSKLVDDFTVFMNQLIWFTRQAIDKHNSRVGFLVKKMERIAPNIAREWVSFVAIKPIKDSQKLCHG